MDLSSIRDAFDRVSKKQKVWYAKTQENVDKVLNAISEAIAELAYISEETLGTDHKTVITALQASFLFYTHKHITIRLLGYSYKYHSLGENNPRKHKRKPSHVTCEDLIRLSSQNFASSATDHQG